MEGRGFHLSRDTSSETVLSSTVIKIPVVDSNSASKNKGNIIYDTNTNTVLVTDGTNWSSIGGPVALGGDVTGPIGANLLTSLQSVPIQTPLFPNPLDVLTFDGVKWMALPATGALPPALQSIANLVTVGNEMIYTIASNTYATTLSSTLGRGFLAYTTQGQQQTALGLTIGGTVQAYSPILDTVVSVASTTDKMLVSSGGVYTNVNTAAYGRSLLAATSQSVLLTTFDAVTGRSNLTTVNTITTVTSPGTITQTGVSIDAFNNITGLNDVTFGGTINSVTTAEFSQLANINATNISALQWGYLGAMDQSVASTTSPTFAGETLNGILNMTNHKIQNVTDPTLNQDAATKKYVDTVAAAGAPPLSSVKYATAAILPNAPIYNSPAETLTAGANAVLVVDGISPLTVGDRVLVKDQADNRENGVYTVTNIGIAGGGGTLWILTRSTDCNQAAMPLSAGTSVFVEIIPGTSNSASTWALQSTVNAIDPLTNPVIWIQIGGVPAYSAGTGIDAAALAGGTIAIINPVSTATGGTGANFSLNTGNVVVTGNATMAATKAAPVGNFVGTTDTQALINKTITDPTNTVRATQLATTGADVVLTAGAPGSAGQVLTLSSPTAASWTVLPVITSPGRTLFVYQGAPNVSPNYSTLNAAITAAMALTPTSVAWVKIEMFAGTYVETTPLYIPPYISVTGLTSAQSDVIIIPAAPAAVGAVLQSKGNVRVSGIVINGFDGAGGYASIGFNSYYDASAAGATDFLNGVTVRNCTLAAFSVAGNPATPTQYSKILICKNCSAQVTTFPFTMTAGFDCSKGGVLSGTDLNVSGFFTGGVNNITYGYRVDNDFSIMDLNVIQASSLINGASIGGTVTSTSQGLYPIFRVNGANFGLISTCGILINSKSYVKINDFKIQDDTGQFPTQKHAIITNAPAASDPNYIAAMYADLRADLVTFSVTGTQTLFTGSDLNEEPSIPTNMLFCNTNVGSVIQSASFTSGGGAPHPLGLAIYTYTGGVFADITSSIVSASPDISIAVDCATTAQIDLSSAPVTIDGFVPTSGVTTVLVKNGSNANPNVPVGPTGYSVDNGVYIWNGAGNPMTRYAPFANGTQYTDKTWFIIKFGTTNYGSEWKLQGQTGGYNIGNITIGTTLLNFLTYSSQAFVNANNNALYIGSIASTQFPYINLSLTYTLKTTSASFPPSSVLTWEYWNGVSWAILPFMIIHDRSPYSNDGTDSFGYNDILIPGTKISHNIYFGPIASSWATTTVNGNLGYWVRMRITDAANITQVPVLDNILLGTSHTEINKDGFVIYYGNARAMTSETIAMTRLYGTGTTGEVAPTANRQICSGSLGGPIIAFNTPNALWGPGVITAAAFTWHPPENIDSSTPLKFYVAFSHDGSTGTQNSIWQIDYAFISSGGGTIAINSGTGTYATRTSGLVTIPITAVAGDVEIGDIPLDITGLLPSGTIIWFKISRQGTNISDTYIGNVYVSSIQFAYSTWAAGKSYALF